MIRRPPRSTLSSSSAASDVYKRQAARPADPQPPIPAPARPNPATRRPQPSRHPDARTRHRSPRHDDHHNATIAHDRAPRAPHHDAIPLTQPVAILLIQRVRQHQVRGGRAALTEQLAAPLLLGALSVALVGQGAYYLRAQVCVAGPVSYTHLRAHETPEHLVCRLLLEK